MRKTVKLIISFMLVLALLMISVGASSTNASDTSASPKAYSEDDIPPPRIGDVNGDGRTNNVDAALVLKLDADLIEYLPVRIHFFYIFLQLVAFYLGVKFSAAYLPVLDVGMQIDIKA